MNKPSPEKLQELHEKLVKIRAEIEDITGLSDYFNNQDEEYPTPALEGWRKKDREEIWNNIDEACLLIGDSACTLAFYIEEAALIPEPTEAANG